MISIPVRYRDAAGRLYADDISVDEARALVASLQRQLDALDPDAAIADAERRMIEAHRRARDLSDMEDNALDQRLRPRLGMARRRAYAETSRLGEEWLALVEARDAKGDR